MRPFLKLTTFEKHCMHDVWSWICLISCVCLYRTLDSKCHELESTTPKFDGGYLSYISPKSITTQECLEPRLH